jgi:GxxExxY protein
VRHFEPWTSDSENDPLTFAIIGCAIDVHRVLGPGLRESAYEESLCYALHKEGLPYVRQAFLPALYENVNLAKAYRPDLIVRKEVIVEIKTVTRLHPVHDAQVLTYLRFSKLQRGLLLNFQVRRMITGVRRLVLTR